MTLSVARPQWIERANPVFAVLHRPVGAARELGVVLCPPFGYEMLCAHRAYRHLATSLAEGGFWALRVDYHGTGDSAGGDLDPDRFSAWLASVGAAVRTLEEYGVRKVALVGVRFGALLAAEYAKRSPVDALVLVAPPASGRVYLRELRAFQSMRSPGASGLPGTLASAEEAVGFVLTKETAAQLEKATLVGDVRPARRVLLVARDDMPGPEAKMAAQLSALDATVKLSRASGYAAMMQEDPVKSVVPEQVWSEIGMFLADDAQECIVPALAAEQTLARIPLQGGESEVLEEIVDVDGMVGILSGPVEGSRRTLPTILLHNVGANHHIGCNRIYVDLARKWATLGFSTLRYDLVGIGDTPGGTGRKENEVYSAACVADSQRAMRWLSETRGVHRFILGGICSGAYVSYYAALKDPRVAGVMLMNPLTFHWREGDSLEVRMRATLKSTQFYRNAALELDTWLRAVRGKVNLGVIARNLTARAWAQMSRSAGQWLGTERETDVAQGFRKLCQRGTRVLLVCGEDDGSRDVVAEHLGMDARRLRRTSNFRYEIVPRTDHTFSPVSAQRDLADRLTSFLLRGQGRAKRGASRRTDSLAATGHSDAPPSSRRADWGISPFSDAPPRSTRFEAEPVSTRGPASSS